LYPAIGFRSDEQKRHCALPYMVCRFLQSTLQRIRDKSAFYRTLAAIWSRKRRKQGVSAFSRFAHLSQNFLM
jgi:hypothetical protein